MPRALTHIAFALALAGALGLALWRGLTLRAPAFAASEYRPAPARPGAPLMERELLPALPEAPEVHAGTLVELADGRLLAAWFGGSREGAGDVAVYGADRAAAGWSAPRVLADRPGSERDLGQPLRKLGNPLLTRDAAGRVWLFYVVVALGGWSTSAVAYKVSGDGGRSFGPARLLVTSPFLNISTLVRARPLALEDGGLALPLYHELLAKLGLVLRLAPDGEPLALARIGSGRQAIQPSLVALGPRDAWALLRRTGDSPPRVLAALTQDGGMGWDAPRPTDLPNPDAGIAALPTPGGMLLAYNPSETDRTALALARSTDGLHWRRTHTLEQGAGVDEFSYPYLIRGAAGDYHLIYTWQRRRMAYLRFNDAWLEAGP